jgi:hypothetical protein
VERFEDCRTLNRLARVARLDVRIGGGVNAAGIQLTYRDTDCAGLILQCAGIVFEGVRQGAALRSEQQQHQHQIRNSHDFLRRRIMA